MRIPLMLALTLAAAVLTGCGGVERKLGRGMNNSMELFRGGEMRRSIEQAGLWDGADAAFSTGLVQLQAVQPVQRLAVDGQRQQLATHCRQHPVLVGPPGW